jgi:hypothetical protein
MEDKDETRPQTALGKAIAALWAKLNTLERGRDLAMTRMNAEIDTLRTAIFDLERVREKES